MMATRRLGWNQAMFNMMRQAMPDGSLLDGAILATAPTPVTAHADEAKPLAEKPAGYG